MQDMTARKTTSFLRTTDRFHLLNQQIMKYQKQETIEMISEKLKT